MLKSIVRTAAIVALAAGSVVAEPEEIQSSILKAEDVPKQLDPWGYFQSYFTGETPSTKDVLVGVASLKPGMEIHPPHTHAEEEFMMVIKGRGTWHLNGKDQPAATGDILYARPNDIHGLKNTSTTELQFVVWKWGGK